MQAEDKMFKVNRVVDLLPKLKRNHMSRPRLVARLEAACEDSIVLVVAPYGYGKSSLVGEWCQTLAQRCNAQVHCLCLPRHYEGSSVLAALTDLVENSGQDGREALACCVVEDVHNLENALLAEALVIVAELRRRGVRIVLTAAAWPNALLGLCATEEVTIIGDDELVFTRGETSAFIGKNTDGSVSESYIELVYGFTQGWPAGVGLLCLETARNAESGSFAHNKYVHGYFSSLVDLTCDSQLAEFLFATSCLDELRPDLCARIMGQQDEPIDKAQAHATAMLEKIEKLGLYLHRDTNDIGSAARYEKPFRLWLIGVLAATRPYRMQEASRIASMWYAERQDDMQAIKHLLMSGDVMSNFEDVWEVAVSGAGVCDQQTWVERISELTREDVAANPAFDVLAGWFFIRSGKSREAAKCVAMGCNALVGALGIGKEEADLIDAHLRCIEANCLTMCGNDRDYIDKFDELMAQTRIADNIGLRCVMTYSLAESLERTGDIVKSQSCYREAIALSELCDDVYARGLAAYNLARRKVEEGDLYEAEQLCRANMDACTDPYRGLLYALIARIDMLGNHIDEAHEALDCARELLEGGNIDFRLDYRIGQALVEEQAGHVDAACSSMMHGVLHAKRIQVRQRCVLTRLQIQWAYLLYRKGDYRRCKDVLAEIGRDEDVRRPDVMLRAKAVEIRLELAEGDLARAASAIESALEVAKGCGCVTSATELRILESRMHFTAGARDKAFLCMAEALEDGARCGLKGLFVREGNVLVDILNEALSARKLKRGAKSFCEAVLTDIDAACAKERLSGGVAVPVKRDLLTAREQQVLDLLNLGLSRKEIADELFISSNTVKAHVGHIYEKLGVGNKLDALHVAREQGASSSQK